LRIKTFYVSSTDEEIIKRFDDIAWRERTSGSKLLLTVIKEYVKHHEDGNPSYSLDQFAEDPELKAVPAFFRNIEEWEKYLFELPSFEIKSIRSQAQSIISRSNNRLYQRGED